MQQTLLAFLAMMIATMASYNQQAAGLRTQEEMLKSEFEIMANAVALQEMETRAASTDWDLLASLDGEQLSVSFAIDSLSIDFMSTWDVEYVDDNGTPSGSPTDVKQAEITITHSRYAFPLVIHSRLFAE